MIQKNKTKMDKNVHKVAQGLRLQQSPLKGLMGTLLKITGPNEGFHSHDHFGFPKNSEQILK